MSRMSSMLKWAATAAILMAAAPGAQAQTTGLTMEQAMAALQASLDYAKRDQSDISLVVVDRDGQPVLYARGNLAAPHNLGLAQRKAYTANKFKMPSLEFETKSQTDPELGAQREVGETIPLGGGVPIMVGNEVIGAVGVSGTKGGQPGDEACAKAGAEAAASMVKRLQAQN
jgi:uncharacterized protein GlcG (DUF336 family)